MRYKVYFTEAADLDFDEIIDYIAKDSPQNALQFITNLQERIENTLSVTPYSGRSYGDATQSVYVHLVSEGHRQWHSVLDNRL